MRETAQYIHFTDEEKRRANDVDLVSFLSAHGEKLLPSGREKRLASDHSVTIRGNEWFDHATGEGGLAVDFVRKYYKLSFPEAVTLLLGGAGVEYEAADKTAEPERAPFELPPENADMKRVYAYLIKERGIDSEVVSAFVREGLIYEDVQHHNVVFVGTDESGEAKHAHKRSTCGDFRQNVESSLPQYSFHWRGGSERLFVFEAPIDMLSFITLNPDNWQQHSYVALCGTSAYAMLWMLEQNENLRAVYFCLDNDDAGIKAADRLGALLEERDYYCEPLLPQAKDWNDELRYGKLGIEMG